MWKTAQVNLRSAEGWWLAIKNIYMQGDYGFKTSRSHDFLFKDDILRLMESLELAPGQLSISQKYKYTEWQYIQIFVLRGSLLVTSYFLCMFFLSVCPLLWSASRCLYDLILCQEWKTCYVRPPQVMMLGTNGFIHLHSFWFTGCPPNTSDWGLCLYFCFVF